MKFGENLPDGFFHKKYIKEFVRKIKMTMNRRDNRVMNDVMKKFDNKDLGKFCVGKLGIASTQYVKDDTRYAQKYGHIIE